MTYSLKQSALLIGLFLIAACSQDKASSDADVIVVGAGIAGLAAALDAAENGARVLVVDINSVGGGHAVKAGGFALVGTELQKKRGYADTPEIAYQDLMAWGETASPEWVRRYVEQSNTMVYEWLKNLGVEFKVVIDTPEDTVPRFHFAAGTAVNAVVPMMQQAFATKTIRFAWNERVTELVIEGGRVSGIKTRNERTGSEQLWRSASVILATGGFQNNLDMVRQNWTTEQPAPDTLLKGAGQFAQGDGYRIAEQAGAAMHSMDKQVTFINGLPDPRDASGTTALTVHNPSAIWVNEQAMRFVNESAPDKLTVPEVLGQTPASMWLIFDQQGIKGFQIRGAVWLNRNTIKNEILNNPTVAHQANSIGELAALTGLPAEMLRSTVSRYNGFVGVGRDEDFRRFAASSRIPPDISEPPFYALHLFPLTRKSMGGPRINSATSVLDTRGEVIAGLYAAGELTGVAGINGSHGGSGTFLGPSVFTGRIAGRTAARYSVGDKQSTRQPPANKPAAVTQPDQSINLTHAELQIMINGERPGYWHFEQAHTQVLERATNCEQCHSASSPMRPALEPEHMAAQLQTCTLCH